MRIVAMDTTGAYGSLALVDNGVIVEELPLHSADGFAHVLFPQLKRLMDRHGWTHDTVAGYAAGAGPGSFTGVRVGLAAVKGLAEAAGVRAAGVSNLKAMAAFGSSTLRASFCDARRGEIYGAVFDAKLNLIGDEVVMPFPRWKALVEAHGPVELLTPSPELFSVEATRTPRSLAGVIGQLAVDALVDPAAIDANYVRRSDAELHWREA